MYNLISREFSREKNFVLHFSDFRFRSFLASTSPNPNMDNVQVLQRYEGYKASIEQMVLEVVKEQLNRRQGAADNITRNFIKFLTTACGLMEVRHLGISISVSGF